MELVTERERSEKNTKTDLLIDLSERQTAVVMQQNERQKTKLSPNSTKENTQKSETERQK